MPTSSFYQSRIAAMKNVLADGRLTQGGVGAAGPVQQPDCVGVESKGREARPILPWSTLPANTDCAEFVFPLYFFLFCHL